MFRDRRNRTGPRPAGRAPRPRASARSRCSPPPRSATTDRSPPPARSCPPRSRQRPCVSDCTAPVSGLSLLEPNSHTSQPLASPAFATSAKYSTGQRLAGPYSAPGHRPSTGVAGRPRFKRESAARALSTSACRRGGGISGSVSPGASASATKRSTVRGRFVLSSRRTVIEQAVTPLTGETGARPGTRHERNDRGLERIGQDDGAVVIARAQFATEAQAHAEIETPVDERRRRSPRPPPACAPAADASRPGRARRVAPPDAAA